ncbi:drug/metabolite transporter (DMT)-like permease [Nakamurella sp. UYEF19]|uniref:DMT family transporter n=1 Tax=Nakamurella sp. UYEF19 TaxID=1756392 RepID=UPI00339A1366
MALVDGVALLLLAALWGASFLFVRVAVPVLGPVALIEVRVALAGLALLAVALLVRRLPDVRRDWRGFLVLGGLSAAAPFTLIAAAELRLSSSLAAILNATTPLFTLLISAVRLRERLSVRRLAGVVLGLAGVVVLVGLGPLRLDGALMLAAGASLLAALFYALGGVYAATRFAQTPALVTATGQQLGAAVLLVVPMLALPPARSPDSGVVLAVLALALACTAVGFGLFYRLIRRVGPAGALSVTFLVPLFGLLWGAVFLHEPLTWATPAGLVLVLAAVLLVTNIRLTGRTRSPSPSSLTRESMPDDIEAAPDHRA